MNLNLDNPAVIFITCCCLLLWTGLTIYVVKDDDPVAPAWAVFGVGSLAIIIVPIVALFELLARSL